MLDLSIIELSQRMQCKIRIILKLIFQCQYLALGGSYIPVLGGNITMPSIVYGMQQLAENVTGIRVPNSGHFIAEEQPEFVIDQLSNFFSRNNTTSNSIR